MKLIFLGTGGGRSVMFSQIRKTGGLFFDMEKTKFILDPGTGSLVHAINLELKPEKWNGVIVSHFHPDHTADANTYLDGLKDPFLIAEEHCILNKRQTKADFDYYPCITPYHQNMAKVHAMKADSEVTINGIKFKATKADHYAPTIGFRITTEGVDVGYTSDSSYFKGMEKYYDGCKLLLINVLVPKGQETKKHWHMSVDGIISLLNAMKQKPQLVVLTHLSFWMMRANLWKQEKIIQDATKVKIMHADDFMSIDLKTLSVTKHREGKSTKVAEFVNKV
ncbi:MAG: MBL fold metallo-hydrolase [Candidatus Aenigmatarchaeota archaeon]